jgi:alkylhydroperoxidase family enzyme
MTRVFVPSEYSEFPQNYVFSTYAPEIGAAAGQFSRAVYEHTRLSLREMEAARIKTAAINGCQFCMQSRAARDFNERLPSSEQALARPMSSRGAIPDDRFYLAIQDTKVQDILTLREQLAVEYADRLGQRPQSMAGNEQFWSAMHANFSDAEITDLTLSIVSWIAFGRAAHALEMDVVCSVEPQSQKSRSAA